MRVTPSGINTVERLLHSLNKPARTCCDPSEKQALVKLLQREKASIPTLYNPISVVSETVISFKFEQPRKAEFPIFILSESSMLVKPQFLKALAPIAFSLSGSVI